jgi:class 3 adenylate cyclase
LIKDETQFIWIEKKTQVKGKGLMDTFLLKRQSARRKSTSTIDDNKSVASDKTPRGRRKSAERCMITKKSSHTAPPMLSDQRPGTPGDAEKVDEQGFSPGASDKSDMSPDNQKMTGDPHSSSSVGNQFGPRRSMMNFSGPVASKFPRLIRYLKGKDDAQQRAMIMNNQDFRSIWLTFLYFCACYAAESFCLVIGQRDSSHPMLIFCVRSIYLVIALVASVWLHSMGKMCNWGMQSSRLSSFLTDIVAVIVLIGFVSSIVSNVVFLPDGSEFWNVFEAFFFLMVLMHMYATNLQGKLLIILCVLVIIIVVAVTGLLTKGGALMWECIVYSLLMSGTQMLAVQSDPRRHRHEQKAICEEHDRVNQLLDSMLPQEVLSEMKMGRLSTAYHYDNMTFMFADIVGFTSFCASHTAEEAVNLVTRLFAEFDETTVSLQIYKVCTIGDAYVVVNEPRTAVEDKWLDCERVYKLAEKMIDIIIRVREQVNHPSLDMRIGLHAGSFVGGVIGTARVRFDIWGEDVLVGNSVESNGKPGRICASAEAKSILENTAVGPHLTWTYHTDFELTYSKRVVQTYVIGQTNVDVQ